MNVAHLILRAAAKSGNLTVVREKPGKVEKVRENVLPVLCYRDCDGHRISMA